MAADGFFKAAVPSFAYSPHVEERRGVVVEHTCRDMASNALNMPSGRTDRSARPCR